MRRGLGFKLVKRGAALLDFVCFLAQRRSDRITVSLALDWATRNKHQRPDESAAVEHCAGLRPAPECDGSLDRIPPLGLLAYRPNAPSPTSIPIQRSGIAACCEIPAFLDPLRSRSYYFLLGLLAVTGFGLARR